MKNQYIALGLVGSLLLGTTIPVWAQDASGAPSSATSSAPSGVTSSAPSGATSDIPLPADSKWRKTQGHSPEGGFSQADQIIFNQQATQGRLEQFCRNIQIGGNISVGLPDSSGSVTLGLLRRFVTLPNVDSPQNLELYQVDQYSPGVGLTPTIDLASRVDAELGLGIGASFALTSTVVRPRALFKDCEGVKELLNLKDVKVVLPPSLLIHPTKERFVSELVPKIQAMEDGELWSLNGLTTISAAPSITVTSGHITAGVSIGGTQNGNATMIVHRLSRTHTRFSLRVSHLHVFNAQGTVADIPVIDILTSDGSLTLKSELEKVFDSAVVSKLVEYLTASFTMLKQVGNQSTQQYLIAFDLDTSDPAQATELAEMMQSDFLALVKKAAGMATLQATERATLEHFDKLTGQHDEVFGKVAELVQTDVGTIDQNHSVTLTLPILGSHSRASNSSHDDVVTVTPNWQGSDQGAASTRELHLATAERPKVDTGFSIPVINKIVVGDNSDSKYTGFYFADNGKLQVIYTHMDAFQKKSAGAVQGVLNQFSEMLTMAGSKGDPAADANPAQFQIALPAKRGETYKSGSLAFTLNINADGVNKAFNATAEEITRSALRVFPGDESLAAKITKVFVQGRDATPAERNAALRNLVAENGNGGVFTDSLGVVVSFLPVPKSHEIGYSGVLRVLVQLADPQDVSANLAMKIDTGVKHEKSETANVSVNQNAANTDLLDAGYANRKRIIQPQYMDINP